MMCPLLSRPCINRQCAWHCGYECAIRLIARNSGGAFNLEVEQYEWLKAFMKKEVIAKPKEQ